MASDRVTIPIRRSLSTTGKGIRSLICTEVYGRLNMPANPIRRQETEVSDMVFATVGFAIFYLTIIVVIQFEPINR